MSDPINQPTTAETGGVMTRRSLLLSLPALALARRLLAQEQAAPLAIRGIHQVTLAVSDLERSLDFYQALFGMAVQARNSHSISMAGDMVNATPSPGPQRPPANICGHKVSSRSTAVVRSYMTRLFL